MSRSSVSISRWGQSGRLARISSIERYHQIVCSELARDTVRKYSTPSRLSAVTVDPQAWISSATQMSSALGSAMASWVRYSCF